MYIKLEKYMYYNHFLQDTHWNHQIKAQNDLVNDPKSLEACYFIKKANSLKNSLIWKN